MKKISASLLNADNACLGQEALSVLEFGADSLHIDIMDNHYVKNLSFGPSLCSSLRKYGIEAEMDVHLMTQSVDDLVVKFADAGANSICFHAEASVDVLQTIALIKSHGMKAGLALNPQQDFQQIENFITHLDLILVMSVVPGAGGQKFIPNILTKISYIKNFLIKNNYKNISIIVDGGVNEQNLAAISQAGADIFVIGSAIFSQSNRKDILCKIRGILANESK